MRSSEYHLLAVFAAVVEERKYTKVAKRLGITQPSVSQSVAKLRDIYNDPLFIREKLGVRPTEFALEIYPDIADAISRLEALSATRTQFDPKSSKRVFRISTISLFEHTLIPDLFRRVEEDAPHITLLVENHCTQKTKDMLRGGSIDIAIEGVVKTPPSIKSQRFYDDELVVVCDKNNSLFSKGTISKEEFLNNQHITLSSLSDNTSFFENFSLNCLEILRKRKVKRQVASYWGLLSSVKDSDSLAIFSRKIATSNIDLFNLKILENDFIDQKVEASIYWSKSRNVDPSIVWLINKVKEASIYSL